MTIQPARHGCHACCLLRAGFLAFQPAVDNMRGTRVVQVVPSFQKILRGLQLTWYVINPHDFLCGLRHSSRKFWRSNRVSCVFACYNMILCERDQVRQDIKLDDFFIRLKLPSA